MQPALGALPDDRAAPVRHAAPVQLVANALLPPPAPVLHGGVLQRVVDVQPAARPRGLAARLAVHLPAHGDRVMLVVLVVELSYEYDVIVDLNVLKNKIKSEPF